MSSFLRTRFSSSGSMDWVGMGPSSIFEGATLSFSISCADAMVCEGKMFT